MKDMNLLMGVEYISSFKRLAYEAWYALAEFVDNSTQSYFNNRSLLDTQYQQEGSCLIVSIEYNKQENKIVISDNSIGMSPEELERALKIGDLKDDSAGRSKYGIGMKTAACWFGNKWTIKTKKLGEIVGAEIVVDINKIVAEKDTRVPTTTFQDDENKHYTIITITELNRQLRGRTLTKIKEYLKSIYRLDFKEYGLVLKWQGETLGWESLENRLYIKQDGKPYKKNFSFTIKSSEGTENEKLKTVKGWVGVLSTGSRDDAGFSVIQNRRVIQGIPKAYKPEKLFGDQELGTNNLVNQRLVGEIYVDGFAVSHTKDKILWEDSEEEQLEDKLFEEARDARSFAQTIRYGKEPSLNVTDKYRGEAIVAFESELKSDELKDKLFLETIPPEKAIELSFKNMVKTTVQTEEPSLMVTVGENPEMVTVKVFFRNSSEFEPYVLIEATEENNTIIVIINILHPYWRDLKSSDGFLMYIRHSVYDGLSEWKARRKTGRLNPDTIKYIKDSFMRLPYEIISNKASSITEE